MKLGVQPSLRTLLFPLPVVAWSVTHQWSTVFWVPTYCGMVAHIANNVEVFEQLGRATVLSRDLLPNFSSHSSITKKANTYYF